MFSLRIQESHLPVQPQASAVFSSRRHILIVTLILLLGLLLRLPLVSGDISEFPQDRNYTTAMLMAARLETVRFADLGSAIEQLSRMVAYQPEFPFIVDVGFFGGRLGFDPVVTARVFNILITLLGAYGVFVLGRSFRDPRIAYLAMLLYLILPFSIFLSRTILPENLMTTVIIWAMVVAARGDPIRKTRERIWFVLLCILCPLTKLPAAIMLPLIAIVYVYKRRTSLASSIATVAVAALLTYLFICLHYNIRPFHPIADAAAIQRQFQHLVATPEEMLSWRAAGVLFVRSILALTFPGLFIMLAGLILLVSGKHLRMQANFWLPAWTLMALAAGLYNIKANSYWICPLVAPGVLLVAYFLMTVASRTKTAVILFILLVAVGLKADPSFGLVQRNLAGEKVYQVANSLQPMVNEPILFRTPLFWASFEYATRRNGVEFENFRQLRLLRRLFAGEFNQYLTSQLIPDQFNQIVFQHWPVGYHDPGMLTLFETKTLDAIGTAADVRGTSISVPLGLGLRIREFIVEPVNISPGQNIRLRIAWEKVETMPTSVSLGTLAGFLSYPVVWTLVERLSTANHFPDQHENGLDLTAFRTPPIQNPVMLEFRNVKGSMPLPLIPRRHTAIHPNIGRPQLQLPSFKHAPVESVEYEFEVPVGLPPGAYLANVVMYNDALHPSPIAHTEFADSQLNISPSASTAQDRYEILPEKALWFSPHVQALPLWWGRSRSHYGIIGNSRLFLTAPLPPGKYELTIVGRGQPAGPVESERWPRLKLQHPTVKDDPIVWKAAHSATRPHRIELDWQGPADFVVIQLDNPYDYPIPDPFPVYLNADRSGRREYFFEKATFTQM